MDGRIKKRQKQSSLFKQNQDGQSAKLKITIA